MITVFAGFDPREEVGYHTFCSSVIHHATSPVTIAPLHQRMLGKIWTSGDKDGSNSFIYTRFLVPYLMGYNGFALFVDGSDMICTGDIAQLWAMRDPFLAVQVVKHDYKTKHPRKYLGTRMESANEDYPRKNWSSLMLMNCAHYDWRRITPESVEKMTGPQLHRLDFIADRFIGGLPVEWNWLADEYGENPDANLLHWTTGIPAFPKYSSAAHSDDWARAAVRINHATS